MLHTLITGNIKMAGYFIRMRLLDDPKCFRHYSYVQSDMT